MANVKNLKKDINYVLGDIIEAVYLFEISTTGKPTTETNDLIDEAIAAFDVLITKVNAKKVENKKEQKREMICLKFKEEHNINLDDRLPLWNVEFELKRDLLRNYKIDTLEDLFCCVNSLHNDIMKRMRLLTKKKKKDETNATAVTE